jgi:hypothetical protein
MYILPRGPVFRHGLMNLTIRCCSVFLFWANNSKHSQNWCKVFPHFFVYWYISSAIPFISFMSWGLTTPSHCFLYQLPHNEVLDTPCCHIMTKNVK